jgi:hypothetical protein
MHKILILASIVFAGSSSFAAGGSTTANGCTRETEVSARFMTTDVKITGGSCVASTPAIYEHAQILMVSICNAIGGQYRAATQEAECDLKVSESSDAPENAVLVSGTCTVDGLLGCKEKGKPAYWGSLRD